MAADETEFLMVTDDSFDRDVIKAPGPVLLDFWATWCGPSRLVTPALQRLVRERGSKVTVARIDVDRSPITHGRYGSPPLPVQALFRGGTVLTRIEGSRAFSYGTLSAVIDALC